MQKNDVLKLECIQTTYDGYGRCFNEGYLILVKDMLFGEVCDVIILKVNKKVAFGKISKIIQSSKYRVKSNCDIAYKCGGCDYQYIDYNHQIEIKRKRVIDCFKQFSNIDIELKSVNTSEHIYRYRNKVQIPCRNNLMGFYRKKSNDIIPFKDCYLQTTLCNEIYHYVNEQIIKLKLSNTLKHILIKQSESHNQVMIVLIVNDFQVANLHVLTDNIIEKFKPTSLILNLNNSSNNVILGEREVLVYGQDYIVDQIDDLKFQISSKSFFQINPYLVSKLYNKVLEFSCITNNDIVVDLYCGTGTISLFLAKIAKKVIGVEIVSKAIENAKENAILNNINNVDFICQDASIAIKKLLYDYKTIDVVVVDPPRKGLDLIGIETIVKLNPKRIVYVSCDPATLARDVAIFNNMEYQLSNIEVFDMFPQTHHVETCVLLSHKDPQNCSPSK